ncbi:MAG: multicopper oxidase family protein [Methyloceanibacter sp.]|uniref:multicopper oxidase family protein n=1 Tax=Methyloceanibacter sp. TaxID=1965321 RepID=UPI003D6CFA55
MDGVLRPFFMRGTVVILALFVASQWLVASAQDSASKFDLSIRPELTEPVALSSKDGILEVRLTVQQDEARLDTVARPVKNFLLFAYELIRGTASNGQMSGENLYPGPTLQVMPGDTLIVHLDNAMTGLTISDFYDPAYTPKGEAVDIYPRQMGSSPFNLHTHGMHISPKGNADNVLLHIPGGMSNTYTFELPKDLPHGAYWYHSHLHMLTTSHVYYGLAGQLAIGRLDGNLPIVTENKIPIRNMLLQYNYVFDRAGGLAQLNNPNWAQYISTLKAPESDQLAKGTYRPLLVPTTFFDSKKGTKYATIWYTGTADWNQGPGSIPDTRGQFHFIPANLQRFIALPGRSTGDIPADPSLPDHRRDMQFTVNGQFQPVVKSKAGQTEIWVLSNISDMAYFNLRLTETATGKHPKIAVVGQDGLPYKEVHHPMWDDGTRLVVPPATRYAIAVTIPAEGELVLEMAPRGGDVRTMTAPGILYTNDGTENPPAELGYLSVEPSALSYHDGFFVFPTQILARAVPSEGKGTTTEFAEGQPLNAYTVFQDLSKVTPDFKRELTIAGMFFNDLASKDDPKAFVYAFDGTAFPNVPLLQPRLDSIEEWTFINHNNDEHPIHIHVNDFQTVASFDPSTGIKTPPEQWFIDNTNVPVPILGPGEAVVQPGTLSLRSSFDHFTGLFVMHCHRLNHEDNGLMTLVNVIPAISSYAVAVPGSKGHAAEVKVYDGNGDKLIATVTPFPGFEGTPSVAIGDINDDSVYDLVVGAGKDYAPEVVVYSGKAVDGKGPFETELARFEAFDSSVKGGVSVAASQIDGSQADNIIVGSGPGILSEVKVFRSKLPELGKAPELFSTFNPYLDDRNGVSVASGFVDFTTGRYSIVTAPGPGSVAQVKVFNFSLMKPIEKVRKKLEGSEQCEPGANKPAVTNAFMPFGIGYRGGLSLATGWLTGPYGGAETIAVGQLAGPGEVKVYTSGSRLQGGPSIYLASAEHTPVPIFSQIANFRPFEGGSGVSVATTSTTVGSDLLVGGLSEDKTVVRKYGLARLEPNATTLVVRQLSTVVSDGGSALVGLGGD